MTGGVIAATVLHTASPVGTERRLRYRSDCRLIIPAGRMHSPSGTNLPLRHLQAQLPRDAAAAGSNHLTAEGSVHSTAEPTQSMIDWWID